MIAIPSEVLSALSWKVGDVIELYAEEETENKRLVIESTGRVLRNKGASA
jgi:bifunctional DNA-binding transcriptional regulator/antitoxin component of YhaV-PrlF toxin-antitoxin module